MTEPVDEFVWRGWLTTYGGAVIAPIGLGWIDVALGNPLG